MKPIPILLVAILCVLCFCAGDLFGSNGIGRYEVMYTNPGSGYARILKYDTKTGDLWHLSKGEWVPIG